MSRKHILKMPFTCIVLHVEPERVGEKDGKRERERDEGMKT